MIYVLAEDKQSMVKIGSTASGLGLKLRLTKLNEGNPRTLSVVAVAKGGHKEEKALHLGFKSERVRGEWFMRGTLVSAFIERHRVDPFTVRDEWPADDITCADAFKRYRRTIAVHVERQRQDRALLRERERQEKERIQQEKLAAGLRVHRCSNCSDLGHYAVRCPHPVAAKPTKPARVVRSQEFSLSPFALASRRSRDNWTVEQWTEWRRWFRSDRKAG